MDETKTAEQIAADEAGHPTANPHGITSANWPYWPRTQEEKAAGLEVEMASAVLVDPNEPYQTGSPINEDQAFEMLTRVHTPNELVPEDERIDTNTRNLATGGALEQDELKRLRNAL